MAVASRTRRQLSFTEAALLGAASLVMVAGCSSKHTGAPVATASGRNVDASWVTAINACWPDLARQGYSADDIRHNLAGTDGFHNAFPVYGAQPGKAIDDLLGKPLTIAPPPDISQLAHSQTPVLTRGQAAEGTGPRMAVVQHTEGSAPPDSFCSIQAGVPQGFSK